jgi:hypothetical protein
LVELSAAAEDLPLDGPSARAGVGDLLVGEPERLESEEPPLPVGEPGESAL